MRWRGCCFGAIAPAEGIEPEEQAARLRSEGFEEVQGYLFGKPTPRQAAEELIATRMPDVFRSTLAIA